MEYQNSGPSGTLTLEMLLAYIFSKVANLPS